MAHAAFPLRRWQDIDASEVALMREPVDAMVALYDRVTATTA
jgi:hypothetical protein